MGVGGPIDDVAPIDDVILGTVIHGTGHTVGQTKAVLTPNPAFATFDALLDAVNYSNNVGRNGPVCIYSTGLTCLGANKRFWLDESGLHAHPAQAAAQTHSTINNIVSIKGRKFVEKIAWRRAGKQLCEAEAIAGQHAAARLGARVDAQADPLIQKANEQFEAKGRKPLDERRAFPRGLSFRHACLGPGNPWRGGPGIAIGRAVGPAGIDPSGRCFPPHPRVDDQQRRGNRPHGDATERRDGAADCDGTAGAPARPAQARREQGTVYDRLSPGERAGCSRSRSHSRDNGVTITLRGQEYYTGDRKQPGMNVTAVYKFVKAPEGFKAVRQGDLQIYGFGLVPGARRSLRQQGIYTALQAKFGKIFGPEIKLQGFKFNNGKLAAAGQLVPQEIIAQDGWLAVGYCRAK